MRLFLRPRRPTPGEPGIAGTVRVDPRTKSLPKRLRPGAIAVIAHLDLDRVSAEALAACGPAAVVPTAAGTGPESAPCAGSVPTPGGALGSRLKVNGGAGRFGWVAASASRITG